MELLRNCSGSNSLTLRWENKLLQLLESVMETVYLELQNIFPGGWKDGCLVKMDVFYYRGPELSSKHPYWGFTTLQHQVQGI